MADFEVRLEGLDAALLKLSSVGAEYRRRVQAAIVAEAEAIMADSKEHYVPVDTGALRGTGHIVPPAGDELMVELGYGGPAVDYAVVVHENPAAHHPVGQWKYLEAPATAAAVGMAERIKHRVEG